LRVNNVSVESSTDGLRFTMLAEPALQSAKDTQTFAVPPTTAQFLRLTITGATGAIATISSVQAHGTFLSEPKAGPIERCWSLNGLPTQFVSNGGAIRGRSGLGSAPLRFDGGLEGALYRFAWVRGPDRGYGAITVSPGGEGLSGIRYFVKTIPKNFGGSWFGEKGDCPPPAPHQSIAMHFLGRREPFALFGLQFDEQDRLIAAGSEEALGLIAGIVSTAGSRRVELTSREFRGATTDASKRRAQTRLDSLRTVLAARGIDVTRIVFTATATPADPDVLSTDLFRAMNSTVEISLK